MIAWKTQMRAGRSSATPWGEGVRPREALTRRAAGYEEVGDVRVLPYDSPEEVAVVVREREDGAQFAIGVPVFGED